MCWTVCNVCIKALTNAPRILPSITLFLLRIHGSGWFVIIFFFFFFSFHVCWVCSTPHRATIATSFSANTLRPDCFIYLCNMHFGSNCHASSIAHTLIIGILTILCTDRIHTLTCSLPLPLSFSPANCSSLAYALSAPIWYSNRIFLWPIDWTDFFFVRTFRFVCHFVHHLNATIDFGTVRWYINYAHLLLFVCDMGA